MLCHGKPLLCGKKTKNSILSEGNESEGEDMYGFLPKKTGLPPTAMRSENIYGPNPRRSSTRRVTFLEEPPKVRIIQRRHSCAENLRTYAARKYNYQPLIPLERLPTYPNSAPAVRRSASVVCGHYQRHAAAVQSPVPQQQQGRPRPPCYHVAVRRAASFSATRGVNRDLGVRRPSCAAVKPSSTGGASQPISQWHRQISSSTSDLYVDSIALKRSQSRDLSAASSTSSVSEATVYKMVGPCDYVSVSVTGKPQRKSFRSSMESSSDDGVDVSFRSSVGSSTDLENADQMRRHADGVDFRPRNDTYQFSMANLEGTQNADLDAILGELNTTLESRCKSIDNSSSQSNTNVARTESPDNDSAFSDSVSLFSSESSTSSNTTPSTHNNQITTPVDEDTKAEKIRLALQKMKEASVKKLFVKVFAKDGSSKSLLVDEHMKCGYVTKLLADKHRMQPCPKWGLVEHLPELYLERVYEEHEPLVENLMQWTRDSKNTLSYVERPERLLLFQTAAETPLIQDKLLQEYLSMAALPTVEGPVYIKMDSKKGWKKYQAVLRECGLYYYKEKTIKSSKELVCLATFDVNQVYYGVGWRKKFKAPTEHCFAIKHPCLQQPKSTKYIKYLCTEDAESLHKWVTAIRLIKHGRQLLDNYQSQMLDDTQLSDDSASSGCDVAFESDFPCGTIKRKPPKLPLTATTRQLASLDTRASNTAKLERTPSLSSLPPPPPELLAGCLTDEEEALDLPPPPPPPRLLQPQTDSFLQDLQKVMRRNWQVSEKCKQDLNTTPQEVLGFRDPLHYKEANVSNWVAEHYGGGQNLYENIYCKSVQTGIAPAVVSVVPVATVQPMPLITNLAVKKRPPPPPPRRAETTQLTTVNLSRCQKC